MKKDGSGQTDENLDPVSIGFLNMLGMFYVYLHVSHLSRRLRYLHNLALYKGGISWVIYILHFQKFVPKPCRILKFMLIIEFVE